MKLFSFIALMLPSFAVAQDVSYHWFMRTPQVITRNMTNPQLTYSSLVSTGVVASHENLFTGVGAFISDESLYGYYWFSGTTISSRPLDEYWILDTNLFGTVAFSPEQAHTVSSWSYLGGFLLHVRHSTAWGNFGFPLILGVSYSRPTVSITMQIMFHFAVSL